MLPVVPASVVPPPPLARLEIGPMTRRGSGLSLGGGEEEGGGAVCRWAPAARALIGRRRGRLAAGSVSGLPPTVAAASAAWVGYVEGYRSDATGQCSVTVS